VSGGMTSGGGMANMSGGTSTGSGRNAPVSGMSAPGLIDWTDIWRQPGAAVPLSTLAEIHVVTGPPMIKNENGMLVGYVYADFDTTQRDLGGWVEDARRIVDSRFVIPPGYRLEWTGQYEFMADMQARLQIIVPITLVLIIGLLFLALRGWGQTFLVLLSVPFAVVGSVWLLTVLNYNLSTAVWVGLIAVAGVATQTSIVVVVYLDQALKQALRDQRLTSESDISTAVISGALRGVRPMTMTVATTVLGLMPLLWESGVGADLSARTAAPVVGGMAGCLFLILLVIPAAYTIWRTAQWRRGSLIASIGS
jgi:copper/silver efflux system protein